MNYFWPVVVLVIIISVVYLRFAYHLGTKKSLQKFLTILIPLALSGTSTRIGLIILPEFILLSYYIAGIGTLIFSIVLKPVLQREELDRYGRITQNSRRLASLIGVATVWLYISVVYFFINIFWPSLLPYRVEKILLLPIEILWFLPHKPL